MKQLFAAGMYRCRKTTGILVAAGLCWLAAALYYILAGCIAGGSLAASQAGSVTGLGDAMIVWLFGSLAIGLYVGKDFENKTIHGAMRYGRQRIVAGYVLMSSVLVLLLVLSYTAGSVICIASGYDMGGAEKTAMSIYMGNIFAHASGAQAGKLALSYLAGAAVYIGQLSVCIPVAVKLKKPVAVTAFGFFFGMITALLATLADKVSLFDKLYRLTPYAYGMDKIGADASMGDMGLGIAVSLIFTALMGLLSWALLRRADIK